MKPMKLETMPAEKVFNKSGKKFCGRESPRKFCCTLPKGHDGEHVATGTRGAEDVGLDNVPIYERWT